jgi:hypothetical protein
MFSRRIPRSIKGDARVLFAALLRRCDHLAYHRDALGEKADQMSKFLREDGAALRDLLAFYDRVAGTEGKGGKSGESWSTAEVRRLGQIRRLVEERTW